LYAALVAALPIPTSRYATRVPWLLALMLLTGCAARALDTSDRAVDINDPLLPDLSAPAADLACPLVCPAQRPSNIDSCCYPGPSAKEPLCSYPSDLCAVTCTCTPPQEDLPPHWMCGCGL
jgi:hypothetical protein